MIITLIMDNDDDDSNDNDHNGNHRHDHHRQSSFTHLTTSTAPALTLGSLPRMETLAVKLPSMLNTTTSVLGGRTAMEKLADDWSTLLGGRDKVWMNKLPCLVYLEQILRR